MNSFLNGIFFKILHMSMASAVVILFILPVRLLLKKAPKLFSYMLWGIVLFRLLCPFTLEIPVSLLPASSEVLPRSAVDIPGPVYNSPFQETDSRLAASLPDSARAPYDSEDPVQIWTFIGELVWLLGMGIILLYSMISMIRLKLQLTGAVKEKGNIYLADHLQSPFVMGVIRPRIYLPSDLNGEEKEYIILHEQTHIRRRDYLVKLAAFLALCIHWFNPMVWVAFILMSRDMEMSCDESVMKRLPPAVRREYAASLLSLASGKKFIPGLPPAFGEGDTRRRIKNIVNFKNKTPVWILASAGLLVFAACTGLAGERGGTLEKEPEGRQTVEATEAPLDITGITIENCQSISLDTAAAAFADLMKLMTDTFEGRGVKLENFSVTFTGEKQEGDVIMVDAVLECDWTEARKPEEDPVIIGMEKEKEKLVDSEDREEANRVISGFLAEMEPEYNKKERYQQYFKVQLPASASEPTFTLFYPFEENGEIILYPAEAYFAENFKENAGQREQLGADTLQESLTIWRQNREAVETVIGEKQYHVFEGLLGDQEVRMLLYRDGDKLTGSYITRNDADGEIRLSGKINYSMGAAIDLNTEDGKLHLLGFIKAGGEASKTGDTIEGTVNPGEDDTRELTLTHAYGLGMDYGSRYSAAVTDVPPERVEDFARQIKEFVAQGKKEELSSLLKYPVSIFRDGSPVTIKDSSEFIKRYDEFITPEWEATVSRAFTKYLWSNYMGIMMEAGELWFEQNPKKDGFSIYTINIIH